MENLYYVIRTNDDGEASIAALDAEELRRRLRSGYWGDAVFMRHLQPGETIHDLAATSGLLIIAGRQTTPTPRTVATDWDL